MIIPPPNPHTFFPNLAYNRCKENIRKLKDIEKKGAKSEYWNEMYLYGGIKHIDEENDSKPKPKNEISTGLLIILFVVVAVAISIAVII